MLPIGLPVILAFLTPCDQALKSAILGDRIIVCCFVIFFSPFIAVKNLNYISKFSHVNICQKYVQLLPISFVCIAFISNVYRHKGWLSWIVELMCHEITSRSILALHGVICITYWYHYNIWRIYNTDNTVTSFIQD
jgi:hypothetical protein